MSEKAVERLEEKEEDVLRHSAGSEKYTSLSKGEKKMPAYQAKLKEKADKKPKRAQKPRN